MSGNVEHGSNGAIRRPIYWLEMRGLKPTIDDSLDKKAEDSLAKPKREPSGAEGGQEFPREGQSLPGKQQQQQQAALKQPPLKAKRHQAQKDPPAYTPGSLEEQWHLEVMDKGRVTCPTCRAVVRKTVAGLQKHMASCQPQEVFTCQHCGKQLRSLAGMKYHLMADHNSLLVVKEQKSLEEQSERDRLRKVLQRMGKLKCTQKGCASSFTSLKGYFYHTQKCGKAAAELENMALRCPHCSKAYRSKAGLVYHLKSEHEPETVLQDASGPGHLKDCSTEPTGGGRVQRRSAKLAAYYLHELAVEQRAKEWPKRKVLQDLIPDDRKLKYIRPRLPIVSQEVLCKWRSEVKMYRRIHCPNQGCGCVYSSVSGLKSHLGSCTLGEFVAGKYKCRRCDKEFVSESGVKYHINTVHAEDWFDVDTNTTKSFAKLHRKAVEQRSPRKKHLLGRSCKKRTRALSPKKPLQGGGEPSQQRIKADHAQLADGEGRSKGEEPHSRKLAHRAGRK